ncbi:MAG: hypothetical protein PHT88_02420 [Candidatus Moranbacteria bacterium]|nr:hypothetical protein [Candidatus Moranbacteria bacterium]
MALQYEQLRQELIDEFDLGVLPMQKQDEILGNMTEVLMKRIFVDTMENLGETGMDEYEKLLEQKPEQTEIEAFIKSRIADYDAMVEKIVAEFKSEMKGDK